MTYAKLRIRCGIYVVELATECPRFSTELAIDVLPNRQLPLAILIPLLLFLLGLSGAGVAQLVEHLICNQRVGGSIPSASSTRKFCRGARAERILEVKINGLVSLDTSPFCVFARVACK
jgi:hypothetical protein